MLCQVICVTKYSYFTSKIHFNFNIKKAVLNEENQSKPSRIVVQPRYVVPDTNCYIDHLDKIKRIIHSKYYELIVPLIG